MSLSGFSFNFKFELSVIPVDGYYKNIKDMYMVFARVILTEQNFPNPNYVSLDFHEVGTGIGTYNGSGDLAISAGSAKIYAAISEEKKVGPVKSIRFTKLLILVAGVWTLFRIALVLERTMGDFGEGVIQVELDTYQLIGATGNIIPDFSVANDKNFIRFGKNFDELNVPVVQWNLRVKGMPGDYKPHHMLDNPLAKHDVELEKEGDWVSHVHNHPAVE